MHIANMLKAHVQNSGTKGTFSTCLISVVRPGSVCGLGAVWRSRVLSPAAPAGASPAAVTLVVVWRVTGSMAQLG